MRNCIGLETLTRLIIEGRGNNEYLLSLIRGLLMLVREVSGVNSFLGISWLKELLN